MISYDEFKKMELRVGRIVEAERVAGSDKLLKLKVDLGCPSDPNAPPGVCLPDKELRQIVAGIGKVYAPESLLGKEIVIVANLEPRQFMFGRQSLGDGGGLESQGMLLAAAGDHGPIILQPEQEVPPGVNIQ